MNILELHNLNKSFGALKATSNVSLNIKKNNIHALIGPNGAGKTTLIKQISGEIMPDSGAIVFNGKKINHLQEYQRAQLGLVRSFQISSLLMENTVLENVALAVQSKQGHSFKFWHNATIDQLRIKPSYEILAQLNLTEVAHKTIKALSHGQRRQCEIAMAIAMQPKLLLLDEPTAGMGVSESQALIQFIKKVSGIYSIVLIEHDMEVVFALAKSITVLDLGAVLITDTPENIRKNPLVRKIYLGDEAC